MSESADKRPMKAIVLAARPGESTGSEDPFFRILQPLGEKKVIDYIMDGVNRLLPREEIYVVVGYQQEKVIEHLGSGYNYVLQEELLGTGHAVLQVAASLQGYEGDLLILYGDTPLFRPASILGMINRHRLKQADLTIFTAITDLPLPYGRIVRDQSGRIVDIIEDANASPEVRSIRELNVGAYVARAEQLFPALKWLEQGAAGGTVLLTDIVHRLIRSGSRVTNYCSYDPDEILGINNPQDLEKAEFILQKRYLRPARAEEHSEIHFGTGGWRAVIGEGFTMHNVRRLCQAIANRIITQNAEDQGVLIGYDHRFLSDRAAWAAAEVFAGNNIPVILLQEPAPTPMITFASDLENVAYGLAFTASHNPPEWNGLKVFRSDGSLLLSDETDEIEASANALSSQDVVKIEADLALAAGVIRKSDYTNAYVDAVESLIDLNAIRDAGLKVVIDPMYGVGQVTLDIILTEARCRVVTIHGRRDPLFGGRSPAPDTHALGLLSTIVRDGHYDLGLATDGDADRIAIVNEQGNYIAVNDLLLLLYYYLHEKRGERGAVVRNLATTHLLDRLAAHFGERAVETPVGFKYIISAMQETSALLGGESSGGLTIRGHILGKDGILAAALVVEMLATSGGKTLSELIEQVYAITGRLYTAELNVAATSEMKVIIPKRLAEKPVKAIGPYPVCSVSHLDGTKFLLENDNWLLLCFSGTEPVLRIFAEADTPEKARELVDWGRSLIYEN